ncbi:hypothetical protein BH09MYX1_BH09MYX1_16920 [soil metagenome]
MSALSSVTAVWSFGALSLLAAVGCSGSSNGAAPKDGGADVSAAHGISCGQMLQCVGECSESDTECADACVARGSTEAGAKATALAECFQNQACSDSTCAQEKCGIELDDCTSAAPPKGGPPIDGNSPTTGSVPADLVGSWARTVWGDTDRITLGADGTGTRFGAVVSNSKYCTTRSTDTEAGVAVVTPDKITIYATDVVNQYKPCDGTLETKAGAPLVVELSWSRKDASTIVVVDSRCVSSHPTDAEAFCRLELTKE